MAKELLISVSIMLLCVGAGASCRSMYGHVGNVRNLEARATERTITVRTDNLWNFTGGRSASFLDVGVAKTNYESSTTNRCSPPAGQNPSMQDYRYAAFPIVNFDKSTGGDTHSGLFTESSGEKDSIHLMI
jgi:hypothetical protein